MPRIEKVLSRQRAITVSASILLAGFYSAATWSLDTENTFSKLDNVAQFVREADVSLKLNLDANRFNGVFTQGLNDDYQYDSQLRRARLTLKPAISKNWSSKIQVAINEGDQTYEIKDLYIRYRGLDLADVKIGKFKEPFGLENITSSANNLFTERGLSTFAIGRNKGISLSKANSRYSWNIGAYEVAQNGKVKADGDRAHTARATYSPVNSVGAYHHIGLSYSHRDLQGAEYEIKTNGGVDSAINFVDTKNIATDTIAKSGLELAWGRGPLSLQGEFQRLHINAIKPLENARYSGYYGQVSYFLTHDYRPYKKGRFSKVKPSSPTGAWELTLRKGRVQSDQIGIANNNTDINIESTVVGVNYYRSSQIKLMLNAIETDAAYINGDNNGSAISLRLQIRI